MKKPLIIAGMAVVATIYIPMTILSQEADEIVSDVVTVTEEMIENESTWISYEEAQSELMPDLPAERVKALRAAVWDYFKSLVYADTDSGSGIYSDYSPETMEMSGPYTGGENITYQDSSGAGIGFYPDNGGYSQVTTWSSNASTVHSGGRAQWDESSQTVVYEGSLTPKEKLAELNYLYRNSYISPGVFHGEKARLLPFLN